MAQKRGSQRGVVRIASSLLLAVFGVLLSLTGCSAGDQDGSLGEVNQGICLGAFCCGTTTCQDLGPCVDVSCDQNIKNTCVYADLKDGTRCEGADGKGICIAPDARSHAICCTGCVGKGANGPVCLKGTQIAACGVAGAECKSCDSGNPCIDSCQSGQCVEDKAKDGEPCREAPGFCNGAACCTGCVDSNGACQRGNTVSACGISVANAAVTCAICKDGNPCTADACNAAGKCVAPAVAGGELCENGDVCDGIGVCDDKAKCVVQPAQACDKSDPCKVFQCDKLQGCVVSSFTTAACNDGDPCTTVDKCNGAGACVGGTPQKCDDGNECTTDSCVPFQGCKAVAGNEGVTCDDGNNCSTGDKCVSGKCLASGGKTCPNDTNPCTTASCDPANQICGQANDNAAKCQSDACHQFTQCTNGVCPVGALIDCADTNPCTKDGCDPVTGCTHTPDDTATCSDGDLCTEGDACQDGECVTKPVVCDAVDDCHKVGTCNDKSGFCDAPRADVGTACDNDTGTCDDKGKCVPTPTPGEGGAGGEAAGVAGAGTGGNPLAEGGQPTLPGGGGAGDEPASMGGEPGTVESGGKAGKSSGGSSSNEGGEPEVPDHVFVRTPGGCSCNVPSSAPGNAAWLVGLALIGGWARRRRQRSPAPNKLRAF